MPKSRPAITVAIPTYNREEVLLDTINDVLSQSLRDLELVVVDQTRTHRPKTQQALDAITDPRFRYFKVTPAAVTTARNFALKKARAPYIIFLDDDVRLSKDLAKTYLETFQRLPDISGIAGQVTQKGFPVLPLLQFDEYSISHGGYTATKPGYTNGFPGGNCALVVKDVLKLDGFDTRYYGNAFREENDLSLRMHQHGKKIYYEPKATLLHLAAPYGGNRVKTHIYDNPGFYANELFFTLRMVRAGCLPRALVRKYREYCRSVRGWRSCKRSILFAAGLLRAMWRILFVGQRSAKEMA